jgi:hypothetical protein
MSWRKSKSEKREVVWPTIKKELQSIGKVEKCDFLDLDHIEYLVNGLKNQASLQRIGCVSDYHSALMHNRMIERFQFQVLFPVYLVQFLPKYIHPLIFIPQS